MLKNVICVVLLFLVGAGGAVVYIKAGQTVSEQVAGGGREDDFCLEHQIAEAECPWCDPSLIEKLGECAGHGVPEALCSRCNEKLIPGFKAENDWCAGHGVPESQCAICLGEDLPPGEEDNLDILDT